MKVGEKIKRLREEQELTQKELAEKVGLSYSVMNRIELGTRPIRDEELKKIAEVLGTTTDYLLGTSNIKNPYSRDTTSNKIEEQNQLPDSFDTPEEAVRFLLEQNVIMGFGGFDIDKLSDEEKVEFANELLHQLKLISYKYKK